MFLLLLQLAALPAPGWADDLETEAPCPELPFRVMNPPTSEKVMNLPLVNAEEAGDPEAARKLASQPGPYGHSELGFRYLSRLFGYPGEFKGKAQVEEWLMEKEIRNHGTQSGLGALWDHWVVNPAKRLSVPRGRVNEIPANAGPEIFFRSRLDQFNYGRCISTQLQVMACQNSLGDQLLGAGDRVYFGGAGSQIRCKVSKNPYGFEAKRKKEIEQGAGYSPEISNGSITTGGGGDGVNSAR